MKSIEITAKRFLRHLHEYYISTTKGLYNMMDDEKWAKIEKYTDKADEAGEPVVITYYSEISSIEVSIVGHTFYFKSNAKASFGTYLYREFFEREEKQLASYTNPKIDISCNSVNTCGTSGTSHYVYYDTISSSTGNTVINGDLTVNGKIIENNKEEVNMKKFGFDFGRAKNVKMSMYGLAVKNAHGSYVAYDRNNNVIVDVDIFNFDAEQYTFKMPVPISSLKIGDLIVHNGKMMYVQDVEEAYDNAIAAIDIAAGEDKLIRLTRNMFGFEYATKVVSLFDSMGNTPNANNPFGNMWMLALADGGSMDTSTLAMMMLMNGQPQTTESGFNPMMLLLMDKDNSKDNLLPLMMMMNMKQ